MTVTFFYNMRPEERWAKRPRAAIERPRRNPAGARERADRGRRGLLANPARPSHRSRAISGSGYRVIPVNPGHREILGERCYPSLSEIPAACAWTSWTSSAARARSARSRTRPSRGGSGFFFMQQGVVDEEAAGRLEEAGIPVAMDRCILVDTERARAARREIRNAERNRLLLLDAGGKAALRRNETVHAQVD